jgi:hypothetical protein
VIWRKPGQIGVTFERRLADTERATLVPNKLDAVADAPKADAAAETD